MERVMKLAVFVGVIVVVVVSAVVLSHRLPEPRTIHRSDAIPPSKAIERGRLVYGQYGCASCHGDDGKGGFANPNSETDEKVPAVVFVQEGYTKPELRDYLLKGNQKVGKERADGPAPPYCMPGGSGLGMSRNAASDLGEYLWSLYPEEEKKKKQEKWQ